MAVKEPVMESAFSLRLLRRRFLINLHTFTINGTENSVTITPSVMESVFSFTL